MLKQAFLLSDTIESEGAREACGMGSHTPPGFFPFPYSVIAYGMIV